MIYKEVTLYYRLADATTGFPVTRCMVCSRSWLRLVLISTMVLVSVVAGCSQATMPMTAGETSSVSKQAEQLLLDQTSSANPLHRTHALEALVDLGHSRAGRLLMNSLDHEYWGVRFAACVGIMEVRFRPARDMLLDRLDDEDRSVRAAAVGALHVIGDKRFTSRLGTYLFDASPVVRRNTALVLGRMGEGGSVTLLRQALRDDDSGVRLQALEALAMLGNQRAVRLLHTSCRSYFDDEASMALLAVGVIGDAKALDVVRRVYEDSKRPGRLGLRLVAGRAMALLGDTRAFAEAVDALDYRGKHPAMTQRIRALAALALGDMGDPAALRPLSQAMQDELMVVRIAAAKAVLHITSGQSR